MIPLKSLKRMLKNEILEIAKKLNVIVDNKATKENIIKKIMEIRDEPGELTEVVQSQNFSSLNLGFLETKSEEILQTQTPEQSRGEQTPVEIQSNNYYVGDNLQLLNAVTNCSIDLIYFDPPYNTGRHFYDFDDKFSSKDEYINFIKLRIIECHRALKSTGTLVIHIEPKISHYFRVLCDEIFGYENFRNEIVWKTGGNAKNKYKLNRFHDIIIVYSKSAKQVFNPIYFPYDEEYKTKSNVKMCSIHKREYVTTAIYNAQPNVNPRLNLRYLWNGHQKQWYVTQEKIASLCSIIFNTLFINITEYNVVV